MHGVAMAGLVPCLHLAADGFTATSWMRMWKWNKPCLQGLPGRMVLTHVYDQWAILSVSLSLSRLR